MKARDSLLYRTLCVFTVLTALWSTPVWADEPVTGAELQKSLTAFRDVVEIYQPETSENDIKTLSPKTKEKLAKWLDRLDQFLKKNLARKLVDSYRVEYPSWSPEGGFEILTGRLYYPHHRFRFPGHLFGKKKRQLSLVVLTHGTQLAKAHVPSNADRGDDTVFGMLTVASAMMLHRGFAVLMPDYHGMGVGTESSKRMHPFCHAESLGRSSTALIKHTLDHWKTGPMVSKFRWDGHLFFMGYSEGGYAAMAAVREMERFPERYPGITVTASAPMAGPYNLSGIERQHLLSGKPFEYLFFLPYLVLGYQRIYGEVFNPYEIFKPDLIEAGLLSKMNGEIKGADVSDWIRKHYRLGLTEGMSMLSLMNEDWVQNNISDENYEKSAAGRALIENDLDRGWVPVSPMLLVHSPTDDAVPFSNSVLASRAFRARGNSQVHLFPLLGKSKYVTHEVGALLAFPSALIYFMTFWK